MISRSFHIWITCISTNEFSLISDLMKLGYEIAPADSKGRVSISTNINSCIIGLAIKKDFSAEEQNPAQIIIDDVSNSAYKIGMKFHSIIVSELSYNTRWLSSNIPDKVKEAQPPSKKILN